MTGLAQPMNRVHTRRRACTLLLCAGLVGCTDAGPLAYPSTWAPRITPRAAVDCHDITGTYAASNGAQLLPFFLFGVLDTESPEWTQLVRTHQSILAAPDAVTVTISSPDPEHLAVLVAMNASPLARQVLKRSHRSPGTTMRWTPGDHTFRCDADGVVITGTHIHDWHEYQLTDAEKQRRYRRPGRNDVGTARGNYRFAKAADGSLVMHEHLYFCLGCDFADKWRQWAPAPSRSQSAGFRRKDEGVTPTLAPRTATPPT